MNVAAQVVGIAIGLLDRFVVVGILLWAWGVDTYANWVALGAIAGTTFLFDLGFQYYHGNALHALATTPGRFQRQVAVGVYCYWSLLGMMSVSLVLIMAGADSLQGALGLVVSSGEHWAAVLGLLWSANMLTCVRAAICQIYRGKGEFARSLFVDHVSKLSAVVLAAAAGLYSIGPVGLSAIYLLTEVLLGWGLMLGDLRRRYPELHLVATRPTAAEVKAMARGLKWLTISFMTPIIWAQGPIFFIGILGLGGLALVQFAIIRTVAGVLRQCVGIASLSVGMELAHEFHAGRGSAAAARLQALGKSITIGIASGAVGCLQFGGPLVERWTGRSDLYEIALMAALLTPIVLIAPALPFSNYLTLRNQPRIAGLASAVQIILGFGLAFGLARPFGVVGLAAGLAIGEISSQWLWTLRLGGRSLGVSPGDYLARCLLLAAGASVWSWIVGHMAKLALGELATYPTLIAGLIWISVGWGLPTWLGLPKALRTRLQSVVLQPTVRSERARALREH